MPENVRATILVVDDLEENRYVVSRILRQAGYATVEGRTGKEALEKASDLPDLILLDIRLPDMTGYEVCDRIKANPLPAAFRSHICQRLLSPARAG